MITAIPADARRREAPHVLPESVFRQDGLCLGTARTILVLAFDVEVHRMFAQLEAARCGNFLLTGFYLRIVELLDVPAVDAHDVIMVVAAVEFEDGFAGLEMQATQ